MMTHISNQGVVYPSTTAYFPVPQQEMTESKSTAMVSTTGKVKSLVTCRMALGGFMTFAGVMGGNGNQLKPPTVTARPYTNP